MPKLLPPTPLKVLRKALKNAKKGIRDTIQEVKELSKELRGGGEE